MTTKPRRAQPMAPEDRKRAILSAVTPLIIEHGSTVTTSEMAAAAGVAEGTLYSVFPDKQTLIIAAVETALDPQAVEVSVSRIDPSLDLATKLTEAADILVNRIESVMALVDALRTLPHDHHNSHDARKFVAKAEAAVTVALTDLFKPHASELAVEPLQAASAFRSLIFGVRHPLLPDEQRLTIDQAVNILITGVATRTVR